MPNKLKNHAIALLARRDHAKAELANKLVTKGYERAEIETVLDELVTTGYLNETRYVENYIRWRQQRGYGPERIASELSSRGIPAGMIAEQLNFTDNAWFIEAHRAKVKHFGNQAVTDFKIKAKQMRFLKYRGFTHEQIQSSFGEEKQGSDPS